MSTGDIALSIFLPVLSIFALLLINWFIYGDKEEIEAKKLEERRELVNVLIAIQNAHKDTKSKSSFSRLTGVEEWLKDEAKKHLYYV